MAPDGKFTIAIVGGGITGLALALALRKRDVGFHVYEKSTSLDDVDARFLLNLNAVKAMRLCNETLYEALEEVATRNLSTDGQSQVLEYLDGYHPPRNDDDDGADFLFAAHHPPETAVVSRKQLIDALSRLLPHGTLSMGKDLVRAIESDAQGHVRLEFADGSHALADAVIGCDGVRSFVRRLVVGVDDPSATSQYSHQYLSRLLVPIEDAARVVGHKRATTNSVYMGYGKRFLTYPDPRKGVLQLVAMCMDHGDWPNNDDATQPTTSEDMVLQFHDWVAPVRTLAALSTTPIQKWAVFDLAEHFPPSFCKGRICLAGDAAHAMAPHLGAGSSTGMEDVAVLAELIADRRVTEAKQLEAVFAAYDLVRRPRTNWLVQASRKAGSLYCWADETAGNDIEDIQRQTTALHQKAWDFNVGIAIAEAKQELAGIERKRETRSEEQRADILRQPYTEMLGLYDYAEKAFTSKD